MSKWSKSMRERYHPYRKSARVSAPLRKIIHVVEVGDNDLFSRGDRVLLECGHEVRTKGMYKARCIYCSKELQNDERSATTDAK